MVVVSYPFLFLSDFLSQDTGLLTSPQMLYYYLQAASHTIFPVLGHSAVFIDVYVFMKYFDFQPNFPHLKSKLVHHFLLILLFIVIKDGLWSCTSSAGLKAS